MMIVMKPTATEEDILSVIDRIESCGARAHPSRGEEVTVIGAVGDREHVQRLGLEGHPGVAAGRPDPEALQALLDASSRSWRANGDRDRRTTDRRRALLDDRRAVHGRVARPDALHRAHRGRTPAPRCSAAAPTSRAPRRTSFQGLGEEGLRILAEAKAQTGLPIVTELMDARDVEPILEVADVIQVGARNMQNYPLLAEIGRTGQAGADQARASARRSKSC